MKMPGTILSLEEWIPISDIVCERYKSSWAEVVCKWIDPERGKQLEQLILDLIDDIRVAQDAKTKREFFNLIQNHINLHTIFGEDDFQALRKWALGRQ